MSDDDRKYSVEIRYNSRLGGGPQTSRSRYFAESVGDALEKSLADLERNIRKHGSIVVTGVTVDEL